MDFEYAFVGGGVVGLSIASGLIARGKRVIVFDGEDTDFRASRGNFGLIWVQSKGLQAPAYARWTRQSASLWRKFADDLEAATGTDLALVQQGGWVFYFTEESLHASALQYQQLADQLGEQDGFEIILADKLKQEEPAIGPRVVGAMYGAHDGHVNPLRLLCALSHSVHQSDAEYLTGCMVESVTALASGFQINSTKRVARAQKNVLTAGFGAASLGPALGFFAPVRPQRGQVIVTQKLAPFIHRLSGIIRQVNEGGVQIGDSNEEVGFDDSQQLTLMAQMADQAVKVYPFLANASIVRSWSALRIMSPDGLPIYQQSALYPGAYLATCYSGITLAAAHARLLPSWLDALYRPPNWAVVPEHDETIICRCESIKTGYLRRLASGPCVGPNQAKGLSRDGMGPCQGRYCGLSVSELFSATNGLSMEEVGYYRLRSPVKVVTLGELASLAVAPDLE